MAAIKVYVMAFIPLKNTSMDKLNVLVLMVFHTYDETVHVQCYEAFMYGYLFSLSRGIPTVACSHMR